MKNIFRTVTALSLACGVFAFTGCTDYEEDINAINNRIDQLEEGKLASVEEQLTSLSSAVDEAKGLINTLDGTVDGLQTALSTLESDTDGLAGRIEDLETLTADLDELKATVEGIDLSIYETIEAAEAAHATFATISKLNEEIGKITGELAKYLTADDLEGYLTENDLAGYLTEEDLAGYLKEDALADYVKTSDLTAQINAAKEYADNAVKALSESLGDVYALKEALNAKADASELSALAGRVEALEVIDFDETIQDAIDKALKNDGSVTGDIAAAIKSATDALQSQITALVGTVKDLANRIQSLVFVPEYNDNCASLVSYTLFGEPVSDKVVVDATFRVTPASLSANLVSQQNENVFAYVLPVKTRSASVEDTKVLGAEDLTVTEVKEGYVNVELTLDAEEYGDLENNPYTFALYVASKEDVETAEAADDVTGIDASTSYSSDYVQIASSTADLELSGKYVLYNGDAAEGEKIYPDTKEYKVAWSVEPTLRNFYEGYTLHINFGTEENPDYLPLDEAAAKLRLDDATAITPNYGPYVTYSKDGIKDYFTVNQEVEPYGTSVDMADDKEMTEVLGESVSVDNTFYFGELSENKIVLTNHQDYTVVNEPIAINVTGAEQAWDYEFALAHADNKDNPTAVTRNIDFAQSYSVEGPLGEMDLAKVLTEGTLVDGGRKVTVKLDGEETTLTPTPALAIESVDVEKNTVNVALKNYKFAQGGVYEYTFAYTYEHPDYPTTEYTVNFVVTLKAMPEDATVDYGQVELKFFTKGVEFIGLEDGYAMAYEKAQGQPWFKDAEEFTASLKLNAATTYSAMKGETEVDETFTYLAIDPEKEPSANQESSFIRLSSSVVKAIDEQFAFETKIKTWYGVTYTFTANGTIPDPEYKLAYDSANAPEGIVYLKYEEVGGVYQLQTVNPANYLHVSGEIADLPADELTVSFEAVTKEDAAAGIVNIPDLSKVLGVDVATGNLTNPDEWVIDWSDYTARELEVNVILKAKNIVVDQKTLTIKAPELIESFEAKAEPVELTRKAGNDKVINLWELLEAVAADGYGDGENFIPASGDEITDIASVNASEAMKLYGATITFDSQLIDKVADNGGSYIGSYNYDSATGTLTYYGDNGTIQSPVTFTIGVTLSYYLDYNGKVQTDPQGAIKTELKVRISEE